MSERTKSKIKFDGYDGRGGLCIWDETLNHIITVVGIGVGKEELKRQEVLATHLVKCWNSHDDLLAACEDFMKFANKDIPKGIIISKSWLDKLRKETHKIETAIAKAK